MPAPKLSLICSPPLLSESVACHSPAIARSAACFGVTRLESGEVLDDEDARARGEAGHGAAGEIEVDAFGEADWGEIERFLADVHEFDPLEGVGIGSDGGLRGRRRNWMIEELRNDQGVAILRDIGAAVGNWTGRLQWLQRPLLSLCLTRARYVPPALAAVAGMVMPAENFVTSGDSQASSIS